MKNSMAFLFQYIEKKHWFFWGYIAVILESITPIIATLLQRDLIDNVFTKKQYDQFPKLLALYAIFFFGPRLWFTVRKVIFFHISYLLQMTLTKKFLKKIYDMPSAEFAKEHVGNLLNQIRTNIAEASDLFVNQILSEAVKNILTILFLVFSLVSINHMMLMIVLGVILAYYALIHQFGNRTKLLSKQVKEQKSNLSIVIEENVSSIREVTAYNRQDWQLMNYEKKFSDYFQAVIKEGFFKNKIMFLSDPLLYGTKLVAILFGGAGVMTKRISIGEFVVGFSFVDQLGTEIGQLFEQSLTGKRLEASVQCICSVFEKESTSHGATKFSRQVESIEFKDVTFRYLPETQAVLNKLSIHFPVGKKIAIVGKSGCGKSTIAQLFIRAYEPDEGTISMNNVAIKDYGNQYTDKVSMVFQQPYFIPSTIRENLVFDKEYEEKEIEKVCREMKCHDFIMNFENQYETQVGERGISLSGGQKQRLAIARAILKNTEVLILDEATSALDAETEYCVQNSIDKLREGKTTIIIAHRIATIQNADIIYVLDKGTVAAKGTHENLLRENNLYKELCALQNIS